MAKTALTQLQDQIEAVRREAYDAGYAAAMQAIRDFAARPATAAAAPVAAPAKPAATPARRGRPPAAKAATSAAKGSGRRPRRGTNAQMIAEILQGIAPRAARPAEIRQALHRDKGAAVAFTSIRHALGQLHARRVVEPGGDGKTWRYLGAAGSPG